MSFTVAGETMKFLRDSDTDEGIDYSYGDNGNDTIEGGLGTDRIFGGKGDDTLLDVLGPANSGPADEDFIDGGPGVNDIDVADGDALDTVCNGDNVSSDAGDSVTNGPCPT